MYMNDKKNRITLRLTDEQFNFVKATSDTMGVSPSDFLRMVVNVTMVAGQKNKTFGEIYGRENDKTNKHD